MSKVIIIGCGGVGTVCAHKCAQNPDVFNEIVIASRNRAKCDAVARAIGKDNITTDQTSWSPCWSATVPTWSSTWPCPIRT